MLADVGLPWHNNQINMPDEIDTSWPFHFKSFELEVLRAKGARVGDPAASGYVCNHSEANLYCIRALQQELRERYPAGKPIVLFDHFSTKLMKSAEAFFGLESHRVNLSQSKDEVLRDVKEAAADGNRPIIFAATVGNANGETDNMEVICEISNVLPLILHVDAARNFDYITTLPESHRLQLGIAKFTLGVKALNQSLRSQDGFVIAGTIVAGGLNLNASASTVALKPATLGGKHARVAYTRASDSTLAGSRDAVSVLWLALQELQFGEPGYRNMYQHCAEVRTEVIRILQSRDVPTTASPYSLDITIKASSIEQRERLVGIGGTLTEKGEVLFAIQPGVKLEDANSILEIMLSTERLNHIDIPITIYSGNQVPYSIHPDVLNGLQTTIDSWKIATRSAAGYPFHMGSLPALGPIIGRFLDIPIPQDWVQARSTEILAARMEAFGLHGSQQQLSFQGAFTNGSTMGNRVGIHVALAHFPSAFVYFSAESHYSVIKTLRDCDTLTNRWAGTTDCRRSGHPRYAQIPCDVDGSISVEALVRQAVADKARCLELGDDYHMVLFANMGTTFVGARDDLLQIRAALDKAGIEISYTHIDGALDFGFDSCGIKLGPPFQKGAAEQIPVVQGITLSHHKAMGGTVSGEMLCYSPEEELDSLVFPVEPRVIFETWLYGQIYTPSDMSLLLEYCRMNAARLSSALEELGIATKFKTQQGYLGISRQQQQQQLIVVLERPLAWIIEEFSLRPEGDWVHFIPMPHITPETVDFFVERIAAVDRQCNVAFSYMMPLLSAVFEQPVHMNRVHCRGSRAEEIAKMAKSLVPLSPATECGQSMGAIVKACLRSALSVAVTGDDGALQAVFLAESLRDMSIRVGPILVSSSNSNLTRSVVDIAKQLLGLMARHMHARLREDRESYTIYLS